MVKFFWGEGGKAQIWVPSPLPLLGYVPGVQVVVPRELAYQGLSVAETPPAFAAEAEHMTLLAISHHLRLSCTVSDRCALYCVARGSDGERMYRKFSDDVVDGTPCNGAPNSVCINGTCQVRRTMRHVVNCCSAME